MNLGARGESLIKSFEKLRLAAYQDERGVWTIGWGHTGSGVEDGLTCTAEQAETWFVGDVEFAVHAVNRDVRTNLTQNQFDAVIAFTFNVGVGAEEHSTLVKVLNAGDLNAAAAEFPRWIHAGGHVSEGLVARRQAERALFLTPEQSVAPAPYVEV